MQYIRTTEGVTVEVQVAYLPQHSSIQRSVFGHIYHISIHNYRSTPIQLLRRKWIIQDADGKTTMVEGDGVIGQQPVIAPGGHFHYNSWTHCGTPVGRMKGIYTVMNMEDRSLLDIEIPAFELIYPPILN